ncbi:MAG: hypothetical protein LBT14_03395 [Treponema sp.]|jgi:hypothetical protein|nr:hypothetical protein [Treponema sp.]
MAQEIDLYALLKLYADKKHSAYIEVPGFLDYLKTYIKHHSGKQSEWNSATKFWAELSKLTEGGTCKLLTDTPERCIYMPRYYTDRIRDAYQSLETMILPFPSEESLGIHLREDEVRIIDGSHEFLQVYFDHPQDTIIKLTFSDTKIDAILVLASMIPKGLLEAALLKVKGYLQHQDNMDYIRYRLAPKLRGKENYLGNVLTQLSNEPMEFLETIEEAGESSYLFWLHFVTVIKHDIIEKYEPLTQDIAIIQAACIIEQFNNYYRGKIDKATDRIDALNDLKHHFEKAPYLYTLDEIIKFTNKNRTPLLELYSQEDLQAYLEAKTASKDNELPELLTLWGNNNEQWFVLRSRFFSLSVRLIIEVRPLVKQAMTERWLRLLKDFDSEPAMKNDEDFEKVLAYYTKEFIPPLAAMMHYKKLPFLYSENALTQESVPETLRLYNQGKASSLKDLLLLNQEELVADIRMTLPFWYSIPLVVRIRTFFKNFGKQPEPFIIKDASLKKGKHSNNAIAMMALPAKKDPILELEANLVPEGHTLDTYLTELQDRWNQLLDKQARENLAEDINALIRNRVRVTTRTLKSAQMTATQLDEMAADLMLQISDLNRLNEKNALQLYIKLDIIKLLQNKKNASPD